MEGIYELYTDGSCFGNPGGVGGVGVYLILPEEMDVEPYTYTRGYKASTNHRMELRTGISGLSIARNKIREGGGRKACLVYRLSKYC